MAYVYREVHYNHPHHTFIPHLLAGLVGTAGGLITLLLAARFVLTALNVDRLTSFASFIFSASYPFVAPFFALFNYQPQTGIAWFDFRTLIALAFWSMAAWVIVRLVTPSSRDSEI